MGQLLAPKVEGPKPEERPTIPDIDETRPIPVLWGEWLITNPQLFWWGDYTVKPITKKVFTGLWFKKITTGFKYSLGMALGLSAAGSANNPLISGVEAITEIQVNEKTLWTGSTGQGGTITIDLPDFLGGNADGGGGGIKAQIEVHTGGNTLSTTQVRSTYLQTQLTRTPLWRGLCYLVWKGPSAGYGYYGNSASLEPLAVKAMRRPEIFAGATAAMISTNDANPVHCLAELFLDKDWGMGEVELDDFGTTWADAAATIQGEDNGFSYYWDRQSSCEEMAEIILRQIDGVVYTDFATGLIEIKLARFDFDPGSLPTYSNDHFLEITSLTRGSWDDTINEVRVNYTSHAKNFKTATVLDLDAANFLIQAGTGISANINYPGASNEPQARSLARRDLQVLTLPLLRFSGTMNREGHALTPGSLFKFSWPEQGIGSVVMRVTGIKPGTIANGVIELDCVEDHFALGAAIFNTGTNGWVDPITGPIAVTQGGLDELPYWYARDGLHRPYAFAARPNGTQLSYQWVLNSAVIDPDATFTPSGQLTAALIQLTDDVTFDFTVDGLADPELIALVVSSPDHLAGHSLIRVDDEWMAYESATDNLDGTITLNNVWRGQLDTTPAAHANNARVWFVGAHLQLTETDFPVTTALTGEFLTQTTTGVLDSATAPDYALTLAGRALKPYPVAGVKVNTSYLLSSVPVTDDIALTWFERNRLTQTELVRQLGATQARETSTTFTVRAYGQTGTLLRTVTGLTADAYTYTRAFELADAGAVQETLRFEIEAIRDGLTSNKWVRYIATPTFRLPMIVMAGTGTVETNTGNYNIP